MTMPLGPSTTVDPSKTKVELVESSVKVELPKTISVAEGTEGGSVEELEIEWDLVVEVLLGAGTGSSVNVILPVVMAIGPVPVILGRVMVWLPITRVLDPKMIVWPLF